MNNKILNLISELERREGVARTLAESKSATLQLMTRKEQEARAETYEQCIALVKIYLEPKATESGTTPNVSGSGWEGGNG